jgi:hypothetical protein
MLWGNGSALQGDEADKGRYVLEEGFDRWGGLFYIRHKLIKWGHRYYYWRRRRRIGK